MNTLEEVTNDTVYEETRARARAEKRERILAKIQGIDYNVVKDGPPAQLPEDPKAPAPTAQEDIPNLGGVTGGEAPMENTTTVDPRLDETAGGGFKVAQQTMGQEPLDIGGGSQSVGEQPRTREEILKSIGAETKPNTPETPNQDRELSNQLTQEGLMSQPSNQEKYGVMDIVRYASGPLVAVGNAALAPIARGADNPLEAFKISGSAFMESLKFPAPGEKQEHYADTIIERNFSELPEVVKGTMKVSLDILADPTTVLGLGFAKVVQKGILLKRLQSMGDEAVTGMGIFEEGVHSLLGFSKGIDETKLTEIGLTARKADRGDEEALATLNTMLADAPVINAAKLAEEAARKTKLDEFKATFGDAAYPDMIMDEVAVLQDLKQTGHISPEMFDNAANMQLGSHFNIDEQAQVMIQQAVSFQLDAINKVRGKTTIKKIGEAAANKQLSDLLGRATKHYGEEEAMALNNFLVSVTNRVQKQHKIMTTNETEMTRAAFYKSFVLMEAIVSKVVGVKAMGGRLNRVQREVATATDPMDKQVDALMKNMEMDEELMTMLGKAKFDILQPHQVAKFTEKVRRGWGRRMYDAFSELYINSLLSAARTHVVNMTSNTAMVSLTLSEKYLEATTAAVRGDFAKAGADVQEAKAMVSGIVSSVSDVFRMMFGSEKVNIKYPEALEAQHELAKQKHTPAITAENFDASGALGKFIDMSGSTVRSVGGMMLKEDKFFKLTNYRMSVNQEAMKRAVAMGKSSEDIKSIYMTYRNNPDETMVKAAMETANLMTFTKKLEGPLGHAEQFLKTPGLNMFIPFFRTPVNIIKAGMRHSLLGNIKYDLGTALRGGPKGDAAWAKIATGSLIPLGLAVGLGDKLTGHINMGTKEGRFRAEYDAPPYSLDFGEEGFLDFKYIEPLRSIFGLVASYGEAYRHLDLTDKDHFEQAEEIAGAVILPFYHVMSENAFLDVFTHIHYLSEAAQAEDKGQGMLMLQKIAASVLVPNFIAQTTNLQMDNTYRMADTFTEKVKKRIWGFSNDMPIKPNAFGEAQYVPRGHSLYLINPFLAHPNKRNAVTNKMMELQVPIPNVSPKEFTFKGIPLELNIEQRSMLGQMIGKGLPENNEFGAPYVPPMMDVLRKTINHPYFKKSIEDKQRTRISGLYTTRKKRMQSLLVKVDPSLRKQFDDAVVERKKQIKDAANQQTGGAQ